MPFSFTRSGAVFILPAHEPTISFPEAPPHPPSPGRYGGASPDPLPQGEETPSARLGYSGRFGACAMCGPTIGNCGLLESTCFKSLDGDVLFGSAAMQFGPGGRRIRCGAGRWRETATLE